MTSRFARVAVVSALLVGAWFGCSSPAPSEKIDAGTSDAGDQRCIVDTYVNDDCDVCENKNCCSERFKCYDDHDCFYANIAFEKCIGAATTGDAGADASDAADGDAADGDAADAVAACWATFATASSVGSVRIACQRDKCKEKCGVP